MKIINAKVFIDGKFHDDLEVKFDHEKILEIGKNLEDKEVIDAKGQYLFAGLLDCHVHGGYQRNLVAIEREDEFGVFEDQVKYLCDRFPSTGVTSFFPTVNPDWSPYEKIAEITRRIRKLKPELKGAEPVKFHFECAFLTMDRYLDQCGQWMVNANKETSDIMVDHDYSDVAIISVAPETEGCMEYLDYIVSKGVMPEIGYDKATAEQLMEAADHGLCQATHLFNGYEPVHHRKSTSNLGVLLDDRVKAQITMDGVHVNPAWVRLILKAKGIENCYGITDFSANAGLEDGEHTFCNGLKFITKDGFVYHKSNGHLAGGSNAMNDMMRRAHNVCGLTREEVGLLFAENPARLTRINDRGKIEVGRKADFVIMDDNYDVIKTLINGEVYYENNKR